MTFLLRTLLVFGVLAGIAPSPVGAQNPYAVARKVNTEVITNYDISQRVRLYAAFGFRPPEPQTLALEELTQDRLKTQAAEELGIIVGPEGLAEAIEQYAAQRQLTVPVLRQRLRSAGVADETFDDFITNEVRWRNVVNARFRRRAAPSDDDLDAALTFAATVPQEVFLLREIAIAFAEHGQSGARTIADRIRRQVAGGSSFSALARQFSRSGTASQGGFLGWTPASRLPPPVAAEVQTLSPGGVSNPIPVPAGLILIQLVDIREETAAERPDVAVSYVRLNLPPTEEAAQGALALGRTFDTCVDAEAAATRYGEGSGRVGGVPEAELEEGLALTIAALDPGEVALTLPTETGRALIMLCSRSVDVDPEQSKRLAASGIGAPFATRIAVLVPSHRAPEQQDRAHRRCQHDRGLTKGVVAAIAREHRGHDVRNPDFIDGVDQVVRRHMGVDRGVGSP